MTQPLLMLSFDIEDWFHCENFKHILPRECWDGMESRAERNTHTILEMLSRHKLKATFFILGWVAERFPGLVRAISSQGHEIASHGYGHEMVYNSSAERFREDIHKTKVLLEDTAGVRVLGYRAPTFSIAEWAFDILKDEGYAYDSSLFPVSFHDRYGSLKHTTVAGITLLKSGIHEVPLPVLKFMFLKVPWAGGGYFRLLPYELYTRGINRILAEDKLFVFYFHPHELDAAQPKIDGLGPLLNFRQRVGLSSSLTKLDRLMTEYPFVSLAKGLTLADSAFAGEQ